MPDENLENFDEKNEEKINEEIKNHLWTFQYSQEYWNVIFF